MGVHSILELRTDRLNKSELMTAKEAAKYLDCSVNHLYCKASSGEIPSVKPMGKRRFIKSELDKWILEQRTSRARHF